MRLTDRWDLFFHENSCKMAWVVGREGALNKDARDQMLFYSWHVEVGTQMTSSARKSIRALSYEIHVCQRKRLNDATQSYALFCWNRPCERRDHLGTRGAVHEVLPARYLFPDTLSSPRLTHPSNNYCAALVFIASSVSSSSRILLTPFPSSCSPPPTPMLRLLTSPCLFVLLPHPRPHPHDLFSSFSS